MPVKEIISIYDFCSNGTKTETTRNDVYDSCDARDFPPGQITSGLMRDKNHKTSILSTFDSLGTYVLKFLHVFFPPLSTFESRDLVSLSSYPSFLLLLEGQLWEIKIREKLCHFLPVTLNNTLNILAYTYCFTKPQNNSVLFKTRAPDNKIKFLWIRLFDRSTYHFNLGSFWFEMRHSI